MSIINNSHAIGVDTRNLVLKTRGTLHVKVGDRYYEIDFRNLGAKEEEEQEKEEYIISVESKDSIESLEYPGDNKLIIGLDGSIFVTKEQTIIDVTPKPQTTVISNNTKVSPQDIDTLQNVYVEGTLSGDSGTFIDFINSEGAVDNFVVRHSISIPDTTIKNKCCQTYKNDDDTIHTSYTDMDFIEIVEVPTYLSIKSGVIIKSTLDLTVPISIGGVNQKVSLKKDGVYIIYLNGDKLVYTKLN